MAGFEVFTFDRTRGFIKDTRLVPLEAQVTIRVNGQEWVTLSCTPVNLKELALGFLYLEGALRSLDELLLLRVCDDEREIEARLTREVPLPAHSVITSGCGRGVTYLDAAMEAYSLGEGPRLKPEAVFSLMRELYERAALYREAGGIHASAISDGEGVIWVAEDIGRHNTLDKLKGYCLLNGIPTEGKVILTTGRISSEMLVKAARMGAPFVVSRTAPTTLAVELARRWNITLIGYARGGRFRVYSGVNRIERWRGPEWAPSEDVEQSPSTPDSSR